MPPIGVAFGYYGLGYGHLLEIQIDDINGTAAGFFFHLHHNNLLLFLRGAVITLFLYRMQERN